MLQNKSLYCWGSFSHYLVWEWKTDASGKVLVTAISHSTERLATEQEQGWKKLPNCHCLSRNLGRNPSDFLFKQLFLILLPTPRLLPEHSSSWRSFLLIPNTSFLIHSQHKAQRSRYRVPVNKDGDCFNLLLSCTMWAKWMYAAQKAARATLLG